MNLLFSHPCGTLQKSPNESRFSAGLQAPFMVKAGGGGVQKYLVGTLGWQKGTECFGFFQTHLHGSNPLLLGLSTEDIFKE